MTERTRRRAFTAALLATTMSACAHGERGEASAQAPARARTPAEQASQTEATLGRAQQRLAADRQAVGQADQARAEARQKLSQAEQRFSESRQRVAFDERNVQQLEAALRDQRAQAEEAAVQAQIQSEQAQGLRLVSGRISEASASRVVLEAQDGQTMSFQVAPRTRVLVGTEQRSVSDLQQGAEARVAYDPREAEPAAVAIHVAPARAQQPPPQGSPPQQR